MPEQRQRPQLLPWRLPLRSGRLFARHTHRGRAIHHRSQCLHIAQRVHRQWLFLLLLLLLRLLLTILIALLPPSFPSPLSLFCLSLVPSSPLPCCPRFCPPSRRRKDEDDSRCACSLRRHWAGGQGEYSSSSSTHAAVTVAGCPRPPALVMRRLLQQKLPRSALCCAVAHHLVLGCSLPLHLLVADVSSSLKKCGQRQLLAASLPLRLSHSGVTAGRLGRRLLLRLHRRRPLRRRQRR